MTIIYVLGRLCMKAILEVLEVVVQVVIFGYQLED